MGFRTLAVALVTAVLATLVVHEAFAQLLQARGRVTDEWGNPLEGVQVEAMREGGGGSNRSSITDEDGEFQMIGLTSSSYQFTYTLDGYQGIRQSREIRTTTRPARVELEALPTGSRLRNETEFDAEGGTPRIKFDDDGTFDFEDAEGEGEGTYGIVELSAVMIVRDYDGPDDKYTITQPVVVTFSSGQFDSLTWNGTTLTKK